jgi:hypothetical protein
VLCVLVLGATLVVAGALVPACGVLLLVLGGGVAVDVVSAW